MQLSLSTCETLRSFLMLHYRLYFKRIANSTNIYCTEKKIVIWNPSENNQDGWKYWDREGYKIIMSNDYRDVLNKINKIL